MQVIGSLLHDFCLNSKLIVSDFQLLPHHNTFTFYSDAHNTVSWLDHVISTHSAHKLITDVNTDTGFVSSDHIPISICLLLSHIECVVTKNNEPQTKINWDYLPVESIKQYTSATESLLQQIPLPKSLLTCCDINCKSQQHLQMIDSFHNEIISCLLKASSLLKSSHCKSSSYHVPGWNEYCKSAHEQAREAFILWQSHNKPKQGYIFDLMKRAHASFKYALRHSKAAESRNRADALARKFLQKDPKDFWKHIKKINNDTSHILASTVVGSTGEQEIAKMWQSHYNFLLNSNNEAQFQQCVTSQVDALTLKDASISFDSRQVQSAIHRLKTGKSPGLDGISGEHYKFADTRINCLLSLLFNSMLRHSYLPPSLMESVIVPIIKDKRGDITSKDNYRPIALTCLTSKILEFLILDECENQLLTTDHQFGFKKKHSTDQCVLMLKQIIEYYNSLSSPVYVCFLDASKAFDRINHWCLFRKLLDKNFPKIIVKLLIYWYTSQLFVIRWGSTLSEFFTVTNGVRQGGILSPMLFNVYMDDLSYLLMNSHCGCNLNGVSLNHLFYADDSVLCAPSPSALQKLINICESFAQENGILYNIKKTKVMCFKPKCWKKIYIPSFTLCDNILSVVSNEKYLGVILSDEIKDDKNLMRQLRCIYSYMVIC